jgi:membrane protein DedA with SNARE-associated domain
MSLSHTSFLTPARPGAPTAARAGRGQQHAVTRTVAAVGVFAVVVLAQMGLVLAPSQLGRHPLLVLAFRPTPAFLLLVGDVVAPATAVLIASVSRTLVDMAYFAVARYGALPLAQRFGIGRNLAAKASRRTATRGLLTLAFFWSSTPVVAAIGLGKTSILRFLTVTGLGNAATSGVLAFSGHQLADHVAPATSWVSAHGGQLTAAIASAVSLSFVLALRRAGRARDRDDVAAGRQHLGEDLLDAQFGGDRFSDLVRSPVIVDSPGTDARWGDLTVGWHTSSRAYQHDVAESQTSDFDHLDPRIGDGDAFGLIGHGKPPGEAGR